MAGTMPTATRAPRSHRRPGTAAALVLACALSGCASSYVKPERFERPDAGRLLRAFTSRAPANTEMLRNAAVRLIAWLRARAEAAAPGVAASAIPHGRRTDEVKRSGA